MMVEANEFEEQPAPNAAAGGELVVDVSGFEGPIDLLLALARARKLDITRISIVELADQYLAWVAAARTTNLELAADYLVMAAWLAYIKSRLLLPDLDSDDEPSGAELAAALAFQLRRLEAMREAGIRLMARPRLGTDFFARGAPERFATVTTPILEVSLYDLLSAYGAQTARGQARTLTIEPSEIYSPEDALARLRGVIGDIPDWANLEQFLPAELRGGGGDLMRRSALATTFAAALQLAKEGKISLRQSHNFGPIHIRGGRRETGGDD